MDRPHLHRPDALTAALAEPEIAAEVLDLLKRRLPEAAFAGLVKAVEKEAAVMLETERGHVHVV